MKQNLLFVFFGPVYAGISRFRRKLPLNGKRRPFVCSFATSFDVQSYSNRVLKWTLFINQNMIFALVWTVGAVKSPIICLHLGQPSMLVYRQHQLTQQNCRTCYHDRESETFKLIEITTL